MMLRGMSYYTNVLFVWKTFRLMTPFASHILPHGSYLVNLAQENPDKAKQAYDAFLDDLQRCEALEIKLYNFQ